VRDIRCDDSSIIKNTPSNKLIKLIMADVFTMERKRDKDIAGLHFGRDGAHFQVASCGVASQPCTVAPRRIANRKWNEDISQNINMHSKRLNSISFKDI
jgi:hypothetical protein